MNKLKPGQAQAAAKLGAQLGANASQKLDVNRLLSQGKNGGATFFTEENNAPSTTISIINPSEIKTANVLFMSPLTAQGLILILGSKEKLLLKFGATHLAFDIELNPVEDEISLECVDQGRTLSELIMYASLNPLRLLSMSLESQKISTGLPDTSNFSSNFKTLWWSPFHKTEEYFLTLRKFQNSGINAPQFLDVNFKKEGFPVLLSDQQFFVMTVKPGTSLIATFTTGYAFDEAQYLYRSIKAADEVVPSFSTVGQ